MTSRRWTPRIQAAQLERRRPTLICCKTVIAKGAPTKANTDEAHGAAARRRRRSPPRARRSAGSIRRSRSRGAVYDAWDARVKGAALEAAWNDEFAQYERRMPELARRIPAPHGGRAAGGVAGARATRSSRRPTRRRRRSPRARPRRTRSRRWRRRCPSCRRLGRPHRLEPDELVGLAARHRRAGRQLLSFGVREFGMSAIANGIALHGGLIPYVGTFLTFSDYSRNALRMAALMKLRSIFVFTHDSIGLGEDGPTHQSIEHAASLRLIPNMDVWRPCDTVETGVAWAAAIERKDGPSSLLFTPAERAVPDARRGRDRGTSAAAATCSPAAVDAARSDHRDRLGSAACARRAGQARRGRHRGARRLDALHQPRSTGRMPRTVATVLPRGRAARSRSRRA